MTVRIKLTEQETRVNNYLVSKGSTDCSWEELAQFAKDPQNVKLKTIMKTVSEIKRKYQLAGVNLPFNVRFVSLSKPKPAQVEINFLSPDFLPPELHAMFQKPAPSKPQQLVQIVRAPAPPPLPKAHVDFVLDKTMKRVKTNLGSHVLNDNEWDVFKYVHANHGRLIPISELRDQVVYPHYGSKTPARWFDAIMRIINNLRRAVPGLKDRLLTVKGTTETNYLFQ